MNGKIGVIGSVMVDITIRVDFLPKAGQNIFAREVIHGLGGKGYNISVALTGLGSKVQFCSYVGNDIQTTEILNNIKKAGINVEDIAFSEYNTGIAYIISSSDAQNIIIGTPLSHITFSDMSKQIINTIKKTNILITTLELPSECIKKIIELSRYYNKKLIIDAGPIQNITPEFFNGVFCVSPNKTELESIVNIELNTILDIEKAAKYLLDFGIENVIVKLGDKGCLVANKQESIIINAHKVNVIDTSAAGDSFMSGLVFSLHKGKCIIESAEFANKCGAIAVTKLGTSNSMPTMIDIDQFENFLI